jgi:hypothetical protein
VIQAFFELGSGSSSTHHFASSLYQKAPPTASLAKVDACFAWKDAATKLYSVIREPDFTYLTVKLVGGRTVSSCLSVQYA